MLRASVLRCLTLSVLLASTAHAHLQVASPFPYRSPLDPAVPWDVKDYAFATSPLSHPGAPAGGPGPFPCKGLIGSQEYTAPPVWTAGETVTIKTQGTATHNGGSCQL